MNGIDEVRLKNYKELENPESCIQHLGDTSKQFTILSQNIRSINKNFDSLVVFLHRLRFKPDIIVLTECWLDDSFNELHLDSYKCFYSTKYLNKCDGIVIFTKSELKICVSEPKFIDANCLRLDVDFYTIITIYRSPSLHDITRFLDSLEGIITKC